MQKTRIRVTQLVLFLAASILIGRSQLPAEANACTNCETKTKCQDGLATGFASCGIEYNGKEDVCKVSSAICPKEPEGL